MLITTLGSGAFADSNLQNFQIDFSYLNFAEAKNTNNKDHLGLKVGYDLKTKFSDNLTTHLNLGFNGVTYPDYTLTIPFFNASYACGDNTFAFGRTKLEKLSFIDEEWALGLQTAFSRQNPIYTEEQGRLGVSYVYKTKQVFLEVYGSPFSIPDQFPGFKVSDSGDVSSSNPWSAIPPKRVRISTGAEFDLKYEVINDSLPELILDHQFGGRIGLQTDYIELLGMYSNRPSKQVSLKLDAKVQTGTESLIEITAEPEFVREHFYGLQAKTKIHQTFTIRNGFYGLLLEESKINANYQTASADYFFITTDLNLQLKQLDLQLSHIYSKKRLNEEDDVVYIEFSRFLYENSLRLSVEKLKYKKALIQLGAIYSYKEEVARFYTEASYGLNKNWSFWGRLNLIHNLKGSDAEDSVSLESGLRSYAALDNLNIGVSYVF